MPDIKVNTDAAGINTAGSNDVDLDLYGLNVPEEDMPDTGPDGGAAANGAATGPAASGSVTANISGPLDFVRDAIKEYRMQDVFTLEDLMDTGRARIIAAAVFSIAAKNGSIYNTIRPKSEQVPVPRFNISLEAAAAMIASTGDVAVLDFGEAECTNGLYAYSYTGKRAGIWTLAQSASGMGMLYKALAALGVRQHEQDTRTVLRLLTATAERLEVKRSADLLAFANGVLDYSGGTPSFTAYLDKDGDANQTYTSIYGRDAYITSKAGVNYNPNAVLPVFTCSNGEKWDPLTHIETATGGNQDAMTILLQSAIFILKGISGGGVIWFMDGTQNGSGGGGKSTTGDILAGVAGRELTGYINLETVATAQFGLGRIVGKSFLFGNETSAGSKAIDQAEQIKALMRGEPVKVENKYEDPFDYAFSGVWIQCMNCDAPKFAERENALYRRVIPVYFPQAFTQNGPELLEIKEQFVKDPRVAEFLAMHALRKYGNIDRYDPDAVARLRVKLKDIRAAGSSAFEFLNTYAPEIKSVETPVGMLYMFYAQWVKLNGYGIPLGLRAFRKEVQQWTASASGWKFEHLENARRIKADRSLTAETYMTENPVPGYADEYGNAFKFSNRIKNHRDRDWLMQDKEMVLNQDEKTRLYTAYRMAAVTAYVMTNAIAEGITLEEFVLTIEQWDSVGSIAPEYTAPVSLPDGMGFWTRASGNVIVISQAGYKRAMIQAKADPSALRNFGSFYKAAQTVNMHGVVTW